jgi:hypothetical protein
MQLEWIESGLKRKSYEDFKSYCNSRGLNLRDYHRLLPLIFFLTSMEERGGKEERAAQGRTRPGRPGGGGAAPSAGATATAAGVGRRGAGARERGRHRRPPPPPPGRGKGAPPRRGNGGGRGVAAGEGERRGREALLSRGGV